MKGKPTAVLHVLNHGCFMRNQSNGAWCLGLG